MTIRADIVPMMPTRPCLFCLCLQEGSVFADFDVDDGKRVFLRRISFDGYGCCKGEFKKMTVEDSARFLSSLEREILGASEIESLLRLYFQENIDLIWPDALSSHELL